MKRKTHNLGELTNVDSRPVRCQFVRVMDGGREVLVLQFRRKSSRRPVEVKLDEIYLAKIGNVELSQALQHLEQGVTAVREARQFHLFERADDGRPLTCQEADARDLTGETGVRPSSVHLLPAQLPPVIQFPLCGGSRPVPGVGQLHGGPACGETH